MRRIVLRLIVAVGVVAFCTKLFATTGELRTPLARFPFHYPLVHVDDGDWSVNCFKDFYIRSADRGFDTCHGTNTVPLTKLFFGKSAFKAQEAFFGGTIEYPGACPELKYITIQPRFKYQERGLNLGVEGEYRLEDSKWRLGGNISLPIKVIELERNVCSATMTAQEGAEGVEPGEGLDLTGVVCRNDETLALSTLIAGVDGLPTGAVVPAYRLDFISGLMRANGMPMVEYGDGWMKIAGVEVALHKEGVAVNNRVVAVLKNSEGTCPSDQFATPSETVNPIAGVNNRLNGNFLSAAGAVVGPVAGDVNRALFRTGQNYTTLGADFATQGQLYIVPIYNSNPGVIGVNTRFEIEAEIVMNAIEEATSDLEDGGVMAVEQYFFNNGVHFCQTERNVGVGDLNLDLYAACGSVDHAWAKFIFGVVFPTGKKICDPKLLLAQPTGNNGHYEAKVALALGWMPADWLGLRGDVSYNHVFRATEKRAAPFKGATVKNIGPCVNARVRWGYFTGHLDVTVFHPENKNLGCTLGYEGYVKTCDKIDLCVKEANEFPIRVGCATTGTILNPNLRELDASILAKDTKRISHKVRGEIFHRWQYCELFAGASYVFAGKNIMKETEAHIGFGIYW